MIHKGATVAIDVSVTHPVSERLSTSEGAAMNVRAKEKIRKYQSGCNNQKMSFEPFIFETYGRFNDEVDKFIKKACQLIAEKQFKHYSDVKHKWTSKISLILQRANTYFITNYFTSRCRQYDD